MEKSHTCRRVHLRISDWQLLMILTNNYLLKNWRSEPKKVRVLMLLLHFFLIEKHTLRYDFTHVYLKSWWYDLQFLRIRVWQTKISNYGSVFILLTPTLPKTRKSRILKKWKNCVSYHFTNVYQKPQSHEVWFLRKSETDRFFLSFWAIFCPFTPLTTL